MAEKEKYLKTDDRLDVGVKPLAHTNEKGQELHDRIIRERKQIIANYKK